MPKITLSDNYKKVVSTGGKETLERLMQLAENWPATEDEQLAAFRYALENTKLIEGKKRLGTDGTRKYNTQRKFEFNLMFNLVRAIFSYYYSSNTKQVYTKVMDEHPLLYQTGVFWTQKDLDEHQP
jgi:hypothetical protein